MAYFENMDLFKKEVFKWFDICFKNPTHLGNGSKNDFYSINGFFVMFYYDVQPHASDNCIQLFITNFENIENGCEVGVNFSAMDSKSMIVTKLDKFKKQLIENKLISGVLYK